MPNPKGTKTFHLIIDEKEKETFERIYPGLMRLFLQRAIHKAINNKDIFEIIFFEEIK